MLQALSLMDWRRAGLRTALIIRRPHRTVMYVDMHEIAQREGNREQRGGPLIHHDRSILRP